MSELSSNGYLIIKVSTASGAIPVEAVNVIVQGQEEQNKDILLSLVTDRNGLTPKISLPAPQKSLSSAPSPSARPYSIYNIDVYKEGYYPQHYSKVPIFDGITAIQNARIIPTAEFDAKDPFYTPENIFEEYENPNL